MIIDIGEYRKCEVCDIDMENDYQILCKNCEVKK